MKIFLLVGAVYGFIAVALGAFGAHGLEGKISEKALANWDKAVQYQMFHAVALFITAFIMQKVASTQLVVAGWSFLVGVVLFSGSLYLYATTGQKFLAMITPFGGLAFLVGWVLLGYAIVKYVS